MKLHYIWIGPPKTGELHQRQDIAGAIAMSKALENGKEKIQFWCPDEHVKAFSSALSSFKNIEVRGCESFIKKVQTKKHIYMNWLSKDAIRATDRVAHIFSESLITGTTRDRVNAKNVFSLFVLYMEGGYTLDSNITPSTESKLNFKAYDHFKAPSYGDENSCNAIYLYGINNTKFSANILLLNGGSLSNQSTKIMPQILTEATDTIMVANTECWMMYSPAFHSAAFRALDTYIFLWPKLREIQMEPNRLREYHEACGSAIIASTLNGVLSQFDFKKYEYGSAICAENCDLFWATKKNSSNNGYVFLDEVGIRKKYQNTHKFKKVKQVKSSVDVSNLQAVDKSWWTNKSAYKAKPTSLINPSTLFYGAVCITTIIAAKMAYDKYCSGTEEDDTISSFCK